MARKKMKSATDQRSFTLVYNDFLESDLLDYYEKIIFIYLKKYANNETLRAFPSLNTLKKVTGISKSHIQKCLESMAKKGIIRVEKQDSKERGHQSNLYTLYDYAEVWKVAHTDDVKRVADEVSTAKMIAELKKLGYTVTKNEKSLKSETDQSTDLRPSKKSKYSTTAKSQVDCTNSGIESQERYSLEDIKQIYQYDILTGARDVRDVDGIMNILYNVLNSNKDTIRVESQNRQRNIVVSRLMKLNFEDIISVIDKFHSQTKKIKNTENYLLTLLYKAREQNHYDMMNTGHLNGDF